MSQPVPVKFTATLGQRLGGAVAAGLAAMITLEVLAAFTDSRLSPARRLVLGILAFAVPALARYLAIARLFVAAGPQGVLIVVPAHLSRRFVPWSQVSHIQTSRHLGRMTVRIATTSGSTVRLPAPYTGFLLQRNPQFSEGVRALRRFADEPSIPSPGG